MPLTTFRSMFGKEFDRTTKDASTSAIVAVATVEVWFFTIMRNDYFNLDSLYIPIHFPSTPKSKSSITLAREWPPPLPSLWLAPFGACITLALFSSSSFQSYLNFKSTFDLLCEEAWASMNSPTLSSVDKVSALNPFSFASSSSEIWKIQSI